MLSDLIMSTFGVPPCSVSNVTWSFLMCLMPTNHRRPAPSRLFVMSSYGALCCHCCCVRYVHLTVFSAVCFSGVPSSESVGASPAARPGPDSYGSLSRRGGQRSLLQAPQQRAGRTAASSATPKRRSLAGSQSSLASSCGGQPPASAIPKPASGAGSAPAAASSPAPSASPAPPSATHTPTSTSTTTSTAASASSPSPAAAASSPAAAPSPSPASRGHDPPEEKALIQLPRQRQLGRGRPAPAVSVALVSPMPQTPEQDRGGGGHPASRGTADQQIRRSNKEVGGERAEEGLVTSEV